MYNSLKSGYIISMPDEPEIYNPDGTLFTNDATPPFHNLADGAQPEVTAAGRPLYWHVFGGSIQSKKKGRKNFAYFTAGPVTKPADAEVRSTTIPGTDGETFSYLGTFDHDPSDAERSALAPKEYR